MSTAVWRATCPTKRASRKRRLTPSTISPYTSFCTCSNAWFPMRTGPSPL